MNTILQSLSNQSEITQQNLQQLNNVFAWLSPLEINQAQEVLLNAAILTVKELTAFFENIPVDSISLPVVPKTVLTGSRGGAYYINSKGNHIWLKKNQREQCKHGLLLGSGLTCPREIKEYNRS